MRAISILAFLLIAACASDEKSSPTPDGTPPPAAAADKILSPSQQAALESRARAIHDRVITIDTHIDIPPNYTTKAADPGERGPMQVDLPKMIEGGLDAGFFIVYVPQGPLTDEGYADAYAAAITKFDAIARQSLLYGHVIEMARSPADVERLAAAQKRIALIGVENGYSLGPSIDNIQEFYDRGARYISITHGGNNQFGTSSTAHGNLNETSDDDAGLTELGEQAVLEMNRLGIMVDVSHASRQTTLDTVRKSKAPVIASHSGVKGVANLPRNLSDKELKAIARNGGVVQIVAFDIYLKVPAPERLAAMNAIRIEAGLTSREAFRNASQETLAALRQRMAALDSQFDPASVKDLVDHIDYAVKRIGIDHVGIASDFGGGGGIKGWMDASETGNVTLELVKRGYSEADIAKLWGGNLLRVWGAVEQRATELNKP